MTSGFLAFPFHNDVHAAVTQLGYTVPTPIQRDSIPVVLSGRDLIGLAQTGTGKTAAFALPIADRLRRGTRGPVRVLVVAPTRELAEQIHEVFQQIGSRTGLTSTTIYGGVSFNRQVHALRSRVDVVVGCPGRILDHLRQKTLDLSKLEVLVLDEADQMFDMGFLPNIREILKRVSPTRQTLLYSATMPDDIRRLASDVLKDPATVEVSNTAPVETVTHALYPVQAAMKQALLLRLLESTESRGVLIFTRTKHGAKRLAQQLSRAGHAVTALQGNLSQNRRQEAIQGFRNGTYDVLVATDIAARGIDIASVTHVINYDIPNTVEAYTHRIGRTGRAARTGDAFTLVTSEDTSMVRSIERALGRRIERRAIAGFEAASELQDDAPRRTRPLSAAVRAVPMNEPDNRRNGRPAAHRRHRRTSSGGGPRFHAVRNESRRSGER